MVTNSVTVFVVRKGNPKNIKTWDDLTKPGIEVINANPFTSGGARWNVLAAYGANSNKGKDEAAGVAYLNALYKNVKVQDDSARKALQTFAGGKGDVLLSYENEAIFAQLKDEEHRLRRARLDHPDREPGGRHQGRPEPDGGQGVPRLRPHPRGPEDLRRQRLPPGRSRACPGAEKFPTPPGAVHHRRLRRLGRGHQEVLRPKGSIMADVERSIGVSVESKYAPCWSVAPPEPALRRRPPRPRRHRRRRPEHGHRAGHRHHRSSASSSSCPCPPWSSSPPSTAGRASGPTSPRPRPCRRCPSPSCAR